MYQVVDLFICAQYHHAFLLITAHRTARTWNRHKQLLLSTVPATLSWHLFSWLLWIDPWFVVLVFFDRYSRHIFLAGNCQNVQCRKETITQELAQWEEIDWFTLKKLGGQSYPMVKSGKMSNERSQMIQISHWSGSVRNCHLGTYHNSSPYSARCYSGPLTTSKAVYYNKSMTYKRRSKHEMRVALL